MAGSVSKSELDVLNEICQRVIVPAITENFFKASPIFKYVQELDTPKRRLDEVRENARRYGAKDVYRPKRIHPPRT